MADIHQKQIWQTWRAKKIAEGWKQVNVFVPADLAQYIKTYAREWKAKNLKGLTKQ